MVYNYDFHVTCSYMIENPWDEPVEALLGGSTPRSTTREGLGWLNSLTGRIGMARLPIMLYLAVLFEAGTLRGARPLALPPRPRGSQVETFVPSTTAEPEGLAVRLVVPREPRYGKGAPIVIHVPGGFSPNGRARPTVLPALGFVDVAFAFPGGRLGARQSGGAYDMRGEASLKALSDVVQFALGKKRDSKGRLISELVRSCNVLTGNLGIVGWSNGGNTCGAALALFGEKLTGLAYYVSMESPYGEGAVAAELGAHLTGLNPAYDPKEGTLDLSRLAYDPQAQPRVVLLALPMLQRLRGTLFFDLNRSGRFEVAEDFPAAGLAVRRGDSLRILYSRRFLKEAERRNLFQPSRPSHIAPLEEARAFWRLRDPLPLLQRVRRTCPHLAMIVCAAVRDHVQVAPDHPHILAQLEGFLAAGIRFVRLNPDASYVRSLLRGAVPHGVPDNDAGRHYRRGTIRKYLEPEGVRQEICVAAACAELADRVQRLVWTPNLNEVLVHGAPAPLPRLRPPLRRRPGMREERPQRIGRPYGSGLKAIEVDCSQEVGTIRSLLGTNRGPYEYRKDLAGRGANLVASYRFLGIDFIRTHDFYGPTDWYVMFPRWGADPEDPASYDFASSDTRLEAICRNGFQCLFRLGISWKGRNPRPINDPPGTIRDSKGRVTHRADRRDFRRWARICAHVVRHYTKGWNQGFRFPIRYWEIWNEPDLRAQFWNGTPRQYYELYEEAARAIKKVDPSLKVGGPASTGALRPEYVEQFIQYCQEHKVPLDFFSWHSYGGRGDFNPAEYAQAAKRVRRALDANGFTATENINDEWNAGIGPRLFVDTPWACAYYASTLVAFLESGVEKAFQYCGDMHPGLGLHQVRTGKPKPCAYAFVAWKRLLRTPVRVKATGTDRRGYAVLAGKNTEGRLVQILVSDFQSGYQGVQLQVRNLPWPAGSTFTLRRFLLDRSHLLQRVEEQTHRGRTWQGRFALRSPAVCLIAFERTK